MREYPVQAAHGCTQVSPDTPTFEIRRLQALAEQLGDIQPVLRLCSTYLSMLPGRIMSIWNGLKEEDEDATMTAVLSLKVSSAMVGALETEHQCRELELMIRDHHMGFVAQALPALQVYGERCIAAGPQLLNQACESLGSGTHSMDA
ncbi:Hpt domain-containing protein [Paenarthrobacter sp. NPDC089322]|uniref:Hpt domain-containing protein n=1 Tax=Paenarthrobacter sp. NPDC089322 TaxID=3155065 RepID=UPI003445013B